MKKQRVKISTLQFLTTSVLVFIGTGAFPQKYEIEKLSLKFTDIERGNRRIPVEIYYPADTIRNNINTCSGISAKFPVICFGHGYLISGKWYAHISEMLVPEGFILIFPGSEAGLFPSHRTLARDINFVLDEIGKLNLVRSSPLYERIDTVKCLMGHSMGGGSSILAAKLSNHSRAIVALAPYDTRPSAVDAASSVKIPALIFSGDNDCITPPHKHQIPIYNSLASADKTLILIKGGTHCQMGVSHTKCSYGEKISGCSKNNICMDEQINILARYLIPWLNFYLKGDKEAGKQFNSVIRNDASIDYEQSRILPAETPQHLHP